MARICVDQPSRRTVSIVNVHRKYLHILKTTAGRTHRERFDPTPCCGVKRSMPAGLGAIRTISSRAGGTEEVQIRQIGIGNTPCKGLHRSPSPIPQILRLELQIQGTEEVQPHPEPLDTLTLDIDQHSRGTSRISADRHQGPGVSCGRYRVRSSGVGCEALLQCSCTLSVHVFGLMNLLNAFRQLHFCSAIIEPVNASAPIRCIHTVHFLQYDCTSQCR